MADSTSNVTDSQLRNWVRGERSTPPDREKVAEWLAALDEVRARERAARPVLDAAVAWEREPDPLDDVANTALMEAAYTYRAAMSAPVEAGATEPAPDAIRASHYVVTFDDLFHVPQGWLSWRRRLARSRVEEGYVAGACRYDHNVDSWIQLAVKTAEHLSRWHPHVYALPGAGAPAEPEWEVHLTESGTPTGLKYAERGDAEESADGLNAIVGRPWYGVSEAVKPASDDETAHGYVVARMTAATAYHGDRVITLWSDDVHRTLTGASDRHVEDVDEPDGWEVYELRRVTVPLPPGAGAPAEPTGDTDRKVTLTMEDPTAPDWGGETGEDGNPIYHHAWDTTDGELRLWVGPYTGELNSGWAVTVNGSGVDVALRCEPDQILEWADNVKAAIEDSRAIAAEPTGATERGTTFGPCPACGQTFDVCKGLAERSSATCCETCAEHGRHRTHARTTQEA